MKTVSKPVEAELERLVRVLNIFQLIQGQGGWDCKSLARECGKTERTIFRDIQLLRDANVPVDYDSERRCYSIRGDFYMQPVELTLDESLALVALAEQVAKNGQIPFTEAAVRAVAKVRGQLPAKIQHELRALEDHLSVRLSRTQMAAFTDDDLFSLQVEAPEVKFTAGQFGRLALGNLGDSIQPL